uniref:AAA+ ATPase domain-containing protein n=2 Tax=Triticum urartu TaxID=4572 RepID=A0A8R7QTL4_TRIUA
MATIEKLIVAAQGIIELAKPMSKGKTDTAKNMQTHTTSAPTEKVTGRDEDRERITTMLRDTNDDVDPSSSNSKCFSVIGIYGISGSGKTTLAQHVCKYEETEDYFDLVMWIHVSQNYSVGEIFKEMFEAASVDKDIACPNYNSLDILEKVLEQKLDGKRFLLVLDDIWCNKDDDKQKLAQEQKLSKLLSPFKVGKRGSKILATSRNKDAFSDLGPGVARTVLPIPDLDEHVFLELFMYYALEGVNVDDPNDPDQIELKIVGAEIAQKLKGSPLAASTVGGQLRRRQNDIDFWREVRDRDLLNETIGALWWSYQHLDEQVRRCFAYCSIFPKRHRLNRDELVKMWVAEGFIQTTNADDMEAVGRDYFHELLATSFVQPGGHYLGFSYYLVHDLMHDLAEQAAGSDCFRIENGSITKVPPNVRHLIVTNAEMVNEEIFKLENLRTLIIDYDYEESLAPVNKDFFEKVFKKLRKLRVLAVNVSWTGIRGGHVLEIPKTIGHLKHLRYLALVMLEQKLVLPTTLANLYHLQMLKFANYSILEVSRDINMGNLTNLQHIIGEIEILFPNIGWLTSLQTLESFGVWTEHGYELKQLGGLNKLRGSPAILNLHNVKTKNEAQDAKLVDKKGLTGL